MTRIKLTVTGAEATAEVEGILTAGMVGIPVSIVYDAEWEGLRKTLVCRSGSETRAVLNVEGEATVAPEVMLPRQTLVLGIEGRNEEGTLVIPTLWAYCGRIQESADVAADPTAGATLPVWAQLERLIGDMDALTTRQRSSLVAAVNEAMALAAERIDPEIAAGAVQAYLKENPPTVVETDPTVPAWAKQPQKPEYTAAEVGALPVTYVPPAAPVRSVNGKTGAVSLSASDVGAMPDSYQPPEPPVKAVNGRTGLVQLAAADLGALPLSGGSLSGPLALTGSLILTEGVHYGPELPDPGTPGRIFLKVVG